MYICNKKDGQMYMHYFMILSNLNTQSLFSNGKFGIFKVKFLRYYKQYSRAVYASE